MLDAKHIGAPDLTQHPPRSMRCRLGGYATLPRLLDKGRATLAGTNGQFNYDGPMDKRILNFLGIDPAALRAELATGKGDGEMLAWINANAKYQREPWEVQQWSDWMDTRGPDSDEKTQTLFTGVLRKFTNTRTDIKSWFDLVDLDDFATFGGRP